MLVALSGHVLVITFLALFGFLEPLESLRAPARVQPSTPAPEPEAASAEDRPMEIETLVDQLDRPELKTEEEKKREEEIKKEEEDKKPPGQVVDIAKPLIEERPDNAKFVSEYDSKVDRESKGPTGRDRAGGVAASLPPVGRPDVTAPQPAVEGGPPEPARSGKEGAPGPLAMRERERVREPARPAVENPRTEEAPAPAEDGEIARTQRPPVPASPVAPKAAAGEGGEKNGQAPKPVGREAAVPGLPGDRRPNLAATPEMLQRAIGKGTGSMDYLKDIDDGESTALNAKRWKHAPFFNRVKRAVANEWHPEVVYSQHDPSGNVYGVKDRVTALRVRLTPDGKLVASSIIQSCGVDFLDDEAIDAFRKAAPFPNPPKDLVEADGTIQFNFGFIFELSGRTSVKVYRYQ